MFLVAAATFGVPAAPELLEGGRRSATGRIRRGELDAAFFPTANATPDRSHKNNRDIAYRTRVKSTPSGGLYEESQPSDESASYSRRVLPASASRRRCDSIGIRSAADERAIAKEQPNRFRLYGLSSWNHLATWTGHAKYRRSHGWRLFLR
jgi:hypothetical protein